MRKMSFRPALLLAIMAATLLVVAGADAITVGPPVNVTKLAGHQSEPTIAINRGNPTQLFATSNQLPSGVAAANSGRKSTDSGATWVNTSLALPFGACCDYQAAADSLGNIFVTYLDTVTANQPSGPPPAPGNQPRTAGANRVMLEYSTDGGATWAAVNAAGLSAPGVIDPTHGVDQPSVAVGGPAGTRSVWVTWNNGTFISARGIPVTGLGTFGAALAAQTAPSSNTVGGQFGDIGVGPTGAVVVTYQSGAGEGPGFVYTNTDADGLGAGGFAAQVTATATNAGKFETIPAQPNRQIDAEANLAYDRSGLATNGRLYLLYTDETPDESNNTDIFVRPSLDNGATWGAAVKVNDDTTVNSQFFPAIHVDQTTGLIGVTFYDARLDLGVPGPNSTNAAANDDARYFGAISSSGGASFGPNFQISGGMSNAVASGNPNEYGDYSWNDFHANKLYPVWSDNSNSTGDNPNGALSGMEIYSAQIVVSTTSVNVAGIAVTRNSRRGASVSWTTAQEAGLAGFNLYRSSGQARVKLNAGLILAKRAGRTTGARYRFVDRTARADVAYTYRLEVVHMDGSRAWSGTAKLKTQLRAGR